MAVVAAETHNLRMFTATTYSAAARKAGRTGSDLSIKY